jgi:hypothetical protein
MEVNNGYGENTPSILTTRSYCTRRRNSLRFPLLEDREVA